MITSKDFEPSLQGCVSSMSPTSILSYLVPLGKGLEENLHSDKVVSVTFAVVLGDQAGLFKQKEMEIGGPELSPNLQCIGRVEEGGFVLIVLPGLLVAL